MSQPAEWPWGAGTIALVQGDITRMAADAIVTAANARLAGGGGVDGAIHRAGGPSILEECRRIGGCPTGGAVATGAGALAARWVIHAVGPIWRGGGAGERELLAAAYANALRLADGLPAAHVAFPSISTGVYAYPVEEAARVALGAITTFLAGGPVAVRRVTLVLYDTATFEAYAKALQELDLAAS